MTTKEQPQSKDKNSGTQKSPTPAVDIQTQQDTPLETFIEHAQSNPRSLTPNNVLQLQRLSGNQAVAKLLTGTKPPSVIQAKLTVGAANDHYEQEADRMADQVMRAPHSPELIAQRTSEEDELQAKPLAESITPLVQRAAEEEELQAKSLNEGGEFTPGTNFESRLAAARGSGTPLPKSTREFMEQRMGADFSGVKVHTDAQSDRLNQAIQAKAFTTGNNIFFRTGAYNPYSSSGRELLAHELTHTVQQGAVSLQRRTVKKLAPAVTQNSIQRHASWEHKMLGDVTPDALEIMGAARGDKTKETGMRVEKTEHSSEFMKVTKGPHAGKVIDQELILHTIEQEIRRLEYFRDQPPKDASKASADKLSLADTSHRYQQTHAKQGAVAASNELGDDKKWQVRLVNVPLKDGHSEIVTYGELNTLADFYGSTKELYQTDPKNFHGIVRGIRQESLFKFMKLYEEISGTQKYQEKAAAAREKSLLRAGAGVGAGAVTGAVGAVGGAVHGLGTGALKGAKAAGGKVPVLGHLVGAIGGGVVGTAAGAVSGAKSGAAFGYQGGTEASSEYAGLGFKGAIGNTGTGDLLGEARLAGMVPGQAGKKALAGKKESAYDAGLARNACHFAPESWHSWAEYHTKARALAGEAWKMKVEANDMANGLSEHLREALLTNADKKAGEALIENGFGDHFLQDSYAAGHLINKTQIMQWYVKWLDTQKWKSDHQSPEAWRKIQQIAYGQEGLAAGGQYDRDQVGTTKALDPQSVENLEGDWQSRFKALGLKIPASVTPGSPVFKFTIWWQKRAAAKGDRTLTIKTVQKEAPVLGMKVMLYLRQLINDGVAKVDGAGIKRGFEAQIGDRDWSKLTFELREDYVPKKRLEFNSLTAGIHGQNEANMREYSKEMSRITYADYHKFLNNAFIQAASNVLHDKFCKEGLPVSSKAGELPFKIYGDNAMLQKESSKGLVHSATTANMSRDTIYSIIDSGIEPYTLNQISDRFPNLIAGQSIIDWHKPGGPLMKICHDEVFPMAQSHFLKGRLAGVKGKVTEQISKDDTEKVHSGEVF